MTSPAAAMASDEQLVERLRTFLRGSDLATTTTATVRRQLESDFSVDLTDKKQFIREQVDLFLSELETERNEEGAEEEEDDGVKEDKASSEDSEDDSGGEEEEAKSNGKGSRSRKREPKKTKEVKKRSGGGGGFTKLCSLSPQLQEFVGVSELARTQVVKKIWEYIRENNLQNPSNRRKIICDERLQSLFKVDNIDMFQMTKALSKHIWPLNSDGAAGPSKSTQKEKQPKRERESSEEPPQKVKKQKGTSGGTSGFMAPLQLSDALAKFTGENALTRAAVVKKMWEYIKENNLQDPADKRNIICDDKLKELFEVDTFTGFTVSKLLASHFVKAKE